MAPIAFPDIGLTSAVFDQIQPRKISRMEGRRVEAVDAYAPYWTAQYSIRPYENTDIGSVLAFLYHRGTFLAYHPLRPRPVTYGSAALSGTKAVGGAFNGDAGINDLTDRLEPVIDGLPDAFVLKAGDLVEFRKSTTERSLHLITADATANSSGVVTLTLSTPVPTGFTDSHTAHFEKPSCVMMITNRSVPTTPSNSIYSFDAEEVFPQ
jgi:hypothetical protein